jgi:hypothetical protein
MNSLSPFLFATGVESSCPTVAGGVRIDQMDRCGHYARWEEDFALVRDAGLNALLYGAPYYRVHIAPDHYDWNVCDAQMHRLRDLGITVIADLCHFGVPTWLGGFQDEAFPVLFAAYAGAFARRYPWIRHFTPVSEIFVCATNSALRGWWNERETSEATFVRAMRNLCMAHELAVEAILAERSDGIIVHAESGDLPRLESEASRMDESRWSALRSLAADLTTGRELAPGMARLLNEHGVTSNDLSFFREHRAAGQRWLGAGGHAHGAPIFHDDTDRAGESPVERLDRTWAELMALRASGVRVKGFAWRPLVDQVDWQCALGLTRTASGLSGLYDLQRRVHPVGLRYREIVRSWRMRTEHDAESDAASA